MQKVITITKKNNDLQLTGFGATEFVGRSCLMLHDNDRKVLLDCGLQLRANDIPLGPEGINEHAKDLDAIILSHAHIDHSAYIPRVYEEGFKGSTFMTAPTKDIMLRLLEDTDKINPDVFWSYDSMEDAYDSSVTKRYKRKFKVADGVTAEFFNAGHVLGAASVVIEWDGQRILYSGDINNKRTPLFNGFEMPEEDVDIVISESTNGTRQVQDRGTVNLDLEKEIQKTFKRGGKFLLPAFALGRSQELLFVLSEFLDPDIPVYIDGMINDMNAITEKYLTPEFVSEHALDLMGKHKRSPLRSENFIPITRQAFESPWQVRKDLMESRDPAVVVSTSGMIVGGPIHSYLELGAADTRNTMALTGYQVEGTPGRAILDGAKELKVNTYRRDGGKRVQLNLRVMRLGYSGHACSQGLKQFISNNNPKQVVLVHGEPTSQVELKETLANGVTPQALHFEKPMSMLG